MLTACLSQRQTKNLRVGFCPLCTTAPGDEVVSEGLLPPGQVSGTQTPDQVAEVAVWSPALGGGQHGRFDLPAGVKDVSDLCLQVNTGHFENGHG